MRDKVMMVVLLVGLLSMGCATKRGGQRAVGPDSRPATSAWKPTTPKAPAAYVHRSSGLHFPATMGGLPYRGQRNYEARYPGMGTSIHYRARGINATLYVYTYRIRKIPTGVHNKPVRYAYNRALREIAIQARRGYYQGLRRISRGIVPLGRSPQPPKAWISAFTFYNSGRAFFSLLCVTGHNGHFIKLRMTYPHALHRPLGRATVKRFLDQLGAILR